MTYDIAGNASFSEHTSPSLSFSSSPAVKPRSLRRTPAAAPVYASARAAVEATQPVLPVYAYNYSEITKAAYQFKSLFPGHTLYAVKVNPDKAVIRTLWQAGVWRFDVASLEEIQIVRKVAPKAVLYYMHPVKSAESIAAAYFDYGVRAFSLDTSEELAKILSATRNAADLQLFVRLQLPTLKSAAIDLSLKFGADAVCAADLLRECRAAADKVGVTFHVGSQCMDPESYAAAIRYTAAVIRDSGVEVDAVDVGGGFPSVYPGMTPPPLSDFMATIMETLKAEGLAEKTLLCEPGRALVANSASLIVRVELRRGNLLYLNDGTYGGLFDAGKSVAFRFPCRLMREGSSALEAFRFAGPTCDSLDMMEGPFMLPADIKTGDYIEIEQMGAYSECMRTGFNGYRAYSKVTIQKDVSSWQQQPQPQQNLV
jgi:ornithine decarboxylase